MKFYKIFLHSLIIVCLLISPVALAISPELYNVEFRQADIKSAVRILAKMANKNIVLPDKIEGTVTASFENIKLDDALSAILKTNAYGMVEEDNILQIVSRKELTDLGEDLTSRSFNLKYAKASVVLSSVQSLVSERGSAIADEMTNSIYVRDTKPAINNINGLIVSLDKKGRQVLIEAKIIEASTDFIRSLGIQWGVTKSGGKIQTAGLTSVGTADSGRALMLNTPATSARGGNPFGGVGLILGSFKGVLTDVQLSVAEQEGDITVLARPTIATLNNQPARIRSGTKFYVKTYGDVNIGGTGTGTVTGGDSANLQEIDTGIELNVTPQISSSGSIQLDIEATQSEADFTQAIEGVPAVQDKTAQTVVRLQDGETTIIGGLFHLKDTRTVTGIPGLMKVPLFGNLFKSRSKAKEKRELLIFLTPRVIESAVTSLPYFSEPESMYNPQPPKVEKNKRTKSDYYRKENKWR
ncbi:MAG: secretin N-terminal domain-containing protein [Pseudomonadota bacterium]